MSKIKTFEGACKVLKLDPKALPDVKKLPKHHRDAIVAHFKLVIITEALNEGWKPDWKNTDQYKYYPWFRYNSTKSGFGFSPAYYDYWGTHTTVGSRLCFKSSELAEYAGTQFKKLYNQYFIL